MQLWDRLGRMEKEKHVLASNKTPTLNTKNETFRIRLIKVYSYYTIRCPIHTYWRTNVDPFLVSIIAVCPVIESEWSSETWEITCLQMYQLTARFYVDSNTVMISYSINVCISKSDSILRRDRWWLDSSSSVCKEGIGSSCFSMTMFYNEFTV